MEAAPNPQLVLPPRSSTCIPLSSSSNSVQPGIKHSSLEKTKCLGYKHIGLSMQQKANSAATTAYYCWEGTTQARCSQHWMLTRPWMGLVWTWEQLELPASPDSTFSKHRCSWGTVGPLTLKKETPGSWRKCFLSKLPRWQSLVLGKIKVNKALRVKYKASSSA